MKIFNTTIKPGESAEIKMDIAKLYTRSTVEVPIIVRRAKKPGPCILLVAGIHGDEINGVEIVRQIVTQGYNKPKRGTVICIPLLNVFGFLNQERKFPDGRDLNRMFPGSEKGSLASRFAYHFMKEVIPHVDYCIDFHTGGAQRFNAAQIRVTGVNEEALHLAKVFDAPFIKISKNKEKTFRDALVKAGKNALLFEGGCSLYLNSNITKIGVQGAVNVMKELGINDFTASVEKVEKDGSPVIITSSKWVRAKHSGMYRPSVLLGEKVGDRVKLGSISDPFGNFDKRFLNTKEGYVLCSNYACLVNQGDALFHIGFE